MGAVPILFSTTEYRPVQSFPGSTNEVTPIKLTPIDPKLLPIYKETTSPKHWSPAWHTALVDCVGHPGTVEALLDVHRQHRETAKGMTYQAIVDLVQSHPALGRDLTGITFEHALPMLQNKWQPFEGEVVGRPWSELCERGIYTNPIDGDPPIPTMRIFDLLKLAKESEKESHIARMVLKTLNYGDPPGTMTTEDALACFFATFLQVHQDTEDNSTAPLFPSGCCYNDLDIKIPKGDWEVVNAEKYFGDAGSKNAAQEKKLSVPKVYQLDQVKTGFNFFFVDENEVCFGVTYLRPDKGLKEQIGSTANQDEKDSDKKLLTPAVAKELRLRFDDLMEKLAPGRERYRIIFCSSLLEDLGEFELASGYGSEKPFHMTHCRGLGISFERFIFDRRQYDAEVGP